MIWLWHDDTPRTAWHNMAIDRAMLHWSTRQDHGMLRLYHWNRDSISFGANEAALRHWDRDAIDARQVPVVRRPSGGRAVWHDARDLTYAVAAPLHHFGNQRTAYRLIHERLALALNRADQQTALAPAPPRLPGLARGACFDVAVGGEVLVAERKTIGSAQLVIAGHLLQHGEIARADRRNALAPFARESDPAVKTSEHDELPPAHELADAIAAAWQDEGAILAPEHLVAEIRDLASDDLPRFQDRRWTWRR